ncbi:DNA-binding beta-propeller fold protein YncE [Pleionea mediterranea]|uniref:DNA-binding beta-propeller fold protein YncE n=2 Tax=Pleionea mediterranea TaxID=523701 RepID=A0A316FI15_9GAMM|nr:DNA-binding beta-propeller fold protein YncE [Pleionea mediterranea]
MSMIWLLRASRWCATVKLRYLARLVNLTGILKAQEFNAAFTLNRFNHGNRPMNHFKLTTAVVALFVLLILPVFAQTKDFQGTVIVVNKKGDSVSFIDLASRQIKLTRATGKGPHELALTDDGLWAVVTDYVGGNSLSVFDVKQAKKVRTIELSEYPRPHGILFLNDQRRVAVSSEGSDSVVIADIHSGKIEKAILTEQKGSHMVALPASSKRVYTTNMGSHTVSEMDIQSGKLLRKLATPKVPEAITVNQSGTELWIGSNEDGLVTLYDLASGKQIKQWEGFSFPYRILLTRDEHHAVIPDYSNNTLDILDRVNQKRLHQLKFDKGTTPKGVYFHPDDRTLFMSAYGKNKIFVIDILSGKVLFELPTGDGPDGVAFTPIVFE